MGVALFDLIVRGGVAAHFDGAAGMVVVQILDGVGLGYRVLYARDSKKYKRVSKWILG